MFHRRKSRLKERSLASKLRRNLMSQVVYRGVAYDTEVRKQEQAQQQPQQYDAQYRGVKFVKEVEKK